MVRACVKLAGNPQSSSTDLAMKRFCSVKFGAVCDTFTFRMLNTNGTVQRDSDFTSGPSETSSRSACSSLLLASHLPFYDKSLETLASVKCSWKSPWLQGVSSRELRWLSVLNIEWFGHQINRKLNGENSIFFPCSTAGYKSATTRKITVESLWGDTCKSIRSVCTYSTFMA